MAILETMINLCDFRGTIEEKTTEELKNYFDKAKALSGRDVSGVYLGFEFCDNGLYHCDYNALLKTIQKLKEYDMKIVFVIPYLHERTLDAFQSFMINLLQESEISEIVVNDLGTLHMLREEMKWQGSISYGRLFDKSGRDLRININEILPKQDHIQVFTEPTVISVFYRNLAKKYQVYAFETDTLPDGVLMAEQWEKDYEVHVHYPRIVMSKPAYCEYDHIRNNGKGKFLFKNGCQGHCRNYGEIIGYEGKRLLYKEGLSVFGLQEKTPDESIYGNFRLIYSGGGPK